MATDKDRMNSSEAIVTAYHQLFKPCYEPRCRRCGKKILEEVHGRATVRCRHCSEVNWFIEHIQEDGIGTIVRI